MGVIVESTVTPTVIIAHSLISGTSCASALIYIQSLEEEEERPRVAKAHDYLCF